MSVDGAAPAEPGEGADDEEHEADDEQPAQGLDEESDAAEEQSEDQQEDDHAPVGTPTDDGAVTADGDGGEGPPPGGDASVTSPPVTTAEVTTDGPGSDDLAGASPASGEHGAEPRVFVAGENDVAVAVAPPASEPAAGILAAVEATLQPAPAGADSIAVGVDEPKRRWWLLAVAAIAVMVIAGGTGVALSSQDRAREREAATPSTVATTIATTTTVPEPRPTIVVDVDQCRSLTAGVVPGHLIVTNLISSAYRDGSRSVGVLTGESRPRDLKDVPPFTFVAVLGQAPETATTETWTIDSAGLVQLWLRWNGTAVETALRRRGAAGWVTEPVPDMRVELNGRFVRWYWPGLLQGTPFATVAASGGQCQAAGLDPATLQPLGEIGSVA